MEAAIKLARAFQSEIESLFVEDRKLIDLATFPFAREISFTGRSSRSISSADIATDLRRLAAQFHRNIEQMAVASDVPIRRRDVRDEPLEALAAACAESGPWNVIAIADPFNATAFPSVQRLFETIIDVTGIVIVGPEARRLHGPVLLAIEDIEQLPGMLRAAERIAAVDEAPISVLLVAEVDRELEIMEAQARLILADRPGLSVEPTRPLKSTSEALEKLRCLAPGLILTRFGGLVAPYDVDFRPFASALECPLLLVR
jgi:hypothetical protein